jgi:hypothetical protein
MRWLILPSVAVMLCWLGFLFSLPATSAPELPSAFAKVDAHNGVPRSSHDPHRLSQSVLRKGSHSVPFRGSAIVPTHSYSFSPEPPKRCLHPYVRRYRTKSVDYFPTLRRAQTTRQP